MEQQTNTSKAQSLLVEYATLQKRHTNHVLQSVSLDTLLGSPSSLFDVSELVKSVTEGDPAFNEKLNAFLQTRKELRASFAAKRKKLESRLAELQSEVLTQLTNVKGYSRDLPSKLRCEVQHECHYTIDMTVTGIELIVNKDGTVSSGFLKYSKTDDNRSESEYFVIKDGRLELQEPLCI